MTHKEISVLQESQRQQEVDALRKRDKEGTELVRQMLGHCQLLQKQKESLLGMKPHERIKALFTTRKSQNEKLLKHAADFMNEYGNAYVEAHAGKK